MRSQYAAIGMGAAASGYLLDSFNRADSSVSIGNLDTGQTWSNTGLGIASNKLYNAAGGTSYCSVDPAHSDFDLSILVPVKPTGDNEFMQFRRHDGSNYFALSTFAGGLALLRHTAGVVTTLGTCAFAAGDYLTVRARGSSLIVQVNSVAGITVTDSQGTSESLLFLVFTDTSMRLDSFSCFFR